MKKIPDLSITSADLIRAKGIDTYVNNGCEINELTVHSDKRSLFFSKHKHLHALLLREETNPLVEEGRYQRDARDHEGEFYLTYEAITLLVEAKIRGHKRKHLGLPYNTRNIFIVKNDGGNLTNILSNLELATDSNAKVIYISGIHSTPFYLGNEGGKIKCFIVDSEAGVYGYPNEIIDSVKTVFPSAAIILSSTKLQKDFYSCSTFAVKVLMYFVKHGHEIFPYLDPVEKNKKTIDGHDCHVLPPNKLMPALLKMCQSQLPLSEEMLQAIVSHKKKMTLAEYLQVHDVNLGGKHMNAAAIVKKYKYLTELNAYLEKILDDQIIDGNPQIPLPLKLEVRHAMYARAPQRREKKHQENPVDVYLEIIHMFEEKIVETPTPSSVEYLEDIKRKFPTFVDDFHKKFDNADKDEDERDLLKTQKLLFVAAYSEIQDLNHVIEYRGFARKLNRLFSSFNNVVDYFKRYAELSTKQPIHDLCLFKLPNSGEWDNDYWAKLVLLHGHEASKFLRLAPHIDKLLSDQRHQREDRKFATDLEFISYLLQHFKYSRAAENPQLASFCIEHYRSEKDFEECLELVKTRLKPFDVLPDITIHGEDIGKQYKKFKFVKLPIDDLRGLFLGEYTACCQSIGKGGAACAIHGMTSIYGGFYVVYENGVIVAQAFAWIGKDGELVFDSWEFINKGQAYLAKLFLVKASELIVKTGFTKVHIGKGGNTPDMNLIEAKKAAEHRDSCSYSDARSQVVLKETPPITVLARFALFAKQNNLPYYKFSYLFAQLADNHYIATELAALIASDELSFDEFLCLIKFYHLVTPSTQDLFFHEKNDANRTLLLKAFMTYGNKMQRLLLLKNNTENTLFETMISFDDVDFFKQCMIYLSDDFISSFVSDGDEKRDRLVHLAAKFNSLAILSFVYQRYYQHLSWNGVVSLKNNQGLSVLFLAAVHKSAQCFELMVAKINVATLTTLLEQQHPNAGTILHQLAINASLMSFQNVATKMHNDSQLTKLMNKKVKLEYYNRDYLEDIFLSAMLANDLKFVMYLINNYCDSQKHALTFILKIQNTDGGYLLKTLIANHAVKVLAFIHQLHENETLWLETLIDRTFHGYWDKNAIQEAMRESPLTCGIYMINSMKSFDSLHRLLTDQSTHGYYHKTMPLDFLKEAKPSPEINVMLRKILAFYYTKKEKVAEILFNEYLPLFQYVIRSQDIDLFNDLLDLISFDPSLVDRILVDDMFYNILVIMMSCFASDQRRSKSSCFPLQTVLQFIDCLLSHCTDEQLKKLFSSYTFISNCPSEVLAYLLAKIEAIDEGRYSIEWASFDKHGVGPFWQAVDDEDDSDSPTAVMIAFYIKQYGKQTFNAMLLQQWRNHLRPMITNYRNLTLLQYVYPLIQPDQEKIDSLYSHLYGHMTCNTPLPVFAWLIEQKEITNEVLLESISSKKRSEVYKGCFDSQLDNLIITAMIWHALTKRLNERELCNIVYGNFCDIFIRAVLGTRHHSSYVDKKKELHCLNAWLLLDEWIKLIRKMDDNHMNLFITKNSGGKTVIDHACDVELIELLKMVLLNCSHSERLELIENYKSGNGDEAKKSKMIQELSNCAAVFQRLDILLALKSELIEFSITKSKPTLFQPMPDRTQFILTILAKIDRRKLFYRDDDDKLCIVSVDTIDTVWICAQEFLKRNPVHPIYKKYDEQMDASKELKIPSFKL